MGQKEKLREKIQELQDRLNTLNRVPDDTFPFNTVAMFVSNNNTVKWFFIKVGEEEWRNVVTNGTGSLSDWIASSLANNVGYFEVYVLTVPNHPFFVSS